MSLLAVHDLAVARGGMRTVEGVTFTIGPGRALILRGPNGIGKTTLHYRWKHDWPAERMFDTPDSTNRCSTS